MVQPAYIIQYEWVWAAELLQLTSTHPQMSQTVYYKLYISKKYSPFK